MLGVHWTETETFWTGTIDFEALWRKRRPDQVFPHSCCWTFSRWDVCSDRTGSRSSCRDLQSNRLAPVLLSDWPNWEAVSRPPWRSGGLLGDRDVNSSVQMRANCFPVDLNVGDQTLTQRKLLGSQRARMMSAPSHHAPARVCVFMPEGP